MRNRFGFQIALKTIMLGILGALSFGLHAETTDPYVIEGDRLSSEQLRKAEDLLQAASRRLPPNLRAKLPSHIPLRWGELRLVHDAVGMERAGQITLSPKLLSGSEKVAVASILHETMHVFEQANPRERVSKDPAFLGITYFSEGSKRLDQDLRSGSLAREASPDAYEYHNPQEAFAVNMEYFLLDEAFACRRPTLFKYLARRFGDPFPNRRCEVNHVVPLSSPAGGRVNLVDLDPDRLFEVTYIEAGKGRSLAAGFGHSMIGLVFCAPHRAQPGPECRYDEAYHVLISYTADTPPGEMSDWKGFLSGHYPVTISFSPLRESVNHYTVNDNRDVTVRPLNLSRIDQRALLERAIEEFWSYQGRYKFLTRNCATETLRLIRASITDKNTHALGHPKRPAALRDNLNHSGWIDPSATTQYAARGTRVELAYQEIRELAGKDAPPHYEGFLQRTSAAQRASLFGKISAPVSREMALSLALDFIELETRAQVKIGEQSQREIRNRLLSACRHPSSRERELCGDLQEFMRAASSTVSGRSIDSPGAYGIPLASELQTSLSTDAPSLRLRELEARLKTSIEAWVLNAQLPSYMAGLESSKFLRELNRYIGGAEDVSTLNSPSDIRQDDDSQVFDH